MDIKALHDRVNTVVRLTFVNGEVVVALLLGVDLVEHEDLTYEVRRVVRAGEPPALGTTLGGTVVARLAELTDWEAV